MLASDWLRMIIEHNELIPILAIVGGLLFATVCVIGSKISAVQQTRAREETKRELAAYVAEGSLSAEQAIAVLTAGETNIDEALKNINAIAVSLGA